MRQGQQHRRGRSRNHNGGGHHNNSNSNNNNRKGQNPLTRSFESNGPDVKVRGTPAHIAEKYLQLARDAQSSGDHVLAENYLQHAEHYSRIILAYREQQGQAQGEAMNGGGRHGMPRHEGEGDDGEGGEGHDDMTSGEPGMGFARQGHGEPLPGSEAQPSMLDEPRPPRHNDQQQRYRDRDRQHRHEPRSETRNEGFERPERSGGERGFDRPRERPYQERGGEQPMGDLRAPREMREHREPRPMQRDSGPRDAPQRDNGPRDGGPRDTGPRDTGPRDTGPRDTGPPPDAEAGADASAPPQRPEGAPRRRERFGISPEHPDFLRRPVRRPRREPEAGFAAEPPPPAPVDEPRD